MSNLTLGGALEQPCEKHHNVRYITLKGLSRLSSNHGKYIFQGLSSNHENVTENTRSGLDSAARLCETRAIGTKTRERKLR